MPVGSRLKGHVQLADAHIWGLPECESKHRIRPGRREQECTGVLQSGCGGDR